MYHFDTDIVVIDEATEGSMISWRCRERLTSSLKDFRLSRSKTEYLECKFTKGKSKIEGKVAIRNATIPRVEKFGPWDLSYIIKGTSTKI